MIRLKSRKKEVKYETFDTVSFKNNVLNIGSLLQWIHISYEITDITIETANIATFSNLSVSLELLVLLSCIKI